MNTPSVAVATRVGRAVGTFGGATLPADQHPAAVYLARLSQSSRRPQGEALELIARLLSGGELGRDSLDWSQVRYQHTQAVRAALLDEEVVGRKYAPATVNRHLSALKGALKEAWRLGQMSAEDHARAVDVESVRGEVLLRGRALASGEIRALFDATHADPLATRASRDAALVSVLYAAGLRRAEVAALRTDNFDPDTGALTVLRGKGSKDRVTYIDNGAHDALTAWLHTRGDTPGPLFLRINKWGGIATEGISAQAVYGILKRLADTANVAAFSPHDLRRSFVSDLLENGADIAAVADLAGHANIQTTARYDRRGEKAKQKAAKLLHVPYRAREAATEAPA